jgi:hypothetical protein
MRTEAGTSMKSFKPKMAMNRRPTLTAGTGGQKRSIECGHSASGTVTPWDQVLAWIL